MLELLFAIILSLAGVSASDAKSQDPTDYPEVYDQAKIDFYTKYGVEYDKDGGITSDSMGS